MTKKTRKRADAAQGPASGDLSAAIRTSAQQIWLAGLGAFAKAQDEGSKVFDKLVREGSALEQVTQGKVSETFAKMNEASSALGKRASQTWDKLEAVFENRVERSLASLGAPTARDFQALGERIERLERAVDALNKTTTSAKAPRRRPASTSSARSKTPAK